VAEQTVKRLVQHGHRVSNAKIALLGLTFKENCPDLRNSRVVDIIVELKEYCCDVLVHDPLADAHEAMEEYGIALCKWEELRDCQAVILAVPHAHYLKLSVEDFGAMMDTGASLIDIKSVLDRGALEAASIDVWRL
jgi:UDP-N-acetyl-D-galactosamine dehydrogenase